MSRAARSEPAERRGDGSTCSGLSPSRAHHDRFFWRVLRHGVWHGLRTLRFRCDTVISKVRQRFGVYRRFDRSAPTEFGVGKIATHSLETATQALSLSRKTWEEFRFETPSWSLILLNAVCKFSVIFVDAHPPLSVRDISPFAKGETPNSVREWGRSGRRILLQGHQQRKKGSG